MKCAFFLNIVVTQGSAIFQLFSGKNKPLLIRGDTFLVLNFGLDIINSVRSLNVQGDGLSSQGLNEDLHSSS